MSRTYEPFSEQLSPFPYDQVRFFRRLAASITEIAEPSSEGGLIDASVAIIAAFCEWSSDTAQAKPYTLHHKP